MNGGQMIAGHVVSELLSLFPWRESAEPVTTICNLSADVYRQFRGYGGTTLVTALIKDGSLSFWCAGDSDLFLLREGKLCALNMRQEYKNDLLIRAFEGAFPHELAFTDLQSSALSEYIGKEKVVCEQNLKPLLLKPDDTLMLCSDGVSDTLTLAQIRDAMTLPPEQCCEKLERDIITADLPEQDNYTAITIRYHGKTTEDYEDGNQENTIA
jgi:serine/threonine protein phosphatase PrpC